MTAFRKIEPISAPEQAPVATREDWLDRAALGASFLCLVHCLALPLVLAALPALARLLPIPQSFHVWVLAFAIPTSAAALLSGRRRYNASWPLVLGLVGLVLLAVGSLWFGETSAETPVTVLGSLTLATAHIANWRLRSHTHRHG